MKNNYYRILNSNDKAEIILTNDKVATLEGECFEFRREYPEQKLYFRGQANKEWKIASSAYRYIRANFPEITYDEKMCQGITDTIRIIVYEKDEFRKLRGVSEENLAYIFQHDEYITPYVDITSNLNVALYFACDQEISSDGVIYIFKTHNASNNNVCSFRLLDEKQWYEESVGSIVNYDTVYLQDEEAFRRRFHQQGKLMKLHEENIQPSDKVWKIIIPKEEKENMLDIELAKTDMYDDFIYPDGFPWIKPRKAELPAQILECHEVIVAACEAYLNNKSGSTNGFDTIYKYLKNTKLPKLQEHIVKDENDTIVNECILRIKRHLFYMEVCKIYKHLSNEDEQAVRIALGSLFEELNLEYFEELKKDNEQMFESVHDEIEYIKDHLGGLSINEEKQKIEKKLMELIHSLKQIRDEKVQNLIDKVERENGNDK